MCLYIFTYMYIQICICIYTLHTYTNIHIFLNTIPQELNDHLVIVLSLHADPAQNDINLRQDDLYINICTYAYMHTNMLMYIHTFCFSLIPPHSSDQPLLC